MRRCCRCRQQQLRPPHCSQLRRPHSSWPAECQGRPSSCSRLLVARISHCRLPANPAHRSSTTTVHCPGRSRPSQTSPLQTEQHRMIFPLQCRRNGFHGPANLEHNWHRLCTHGANLMTYQVPMLHVHRSRCERTSPPCPAQILWYQPQCGHANQHRSWSSPRWLPPRLTRSRGSCAPSDLAR